REGLVDAGELVAERSAEVLLVAEHDVDLDGEPSVDLDRPIGPADALPQRRAVVEVVRDDCSGGTGRLHRLLRNLGGRLREAGEDSARVEPASPVALEDPGPVDLARADLRGRGVPAVGAADRAPDAETALGEVESVADRAPDAVVRNPADL